MSAYQELKERYRRLEALDNAQGILNWDREIIMRDGSAPARAEVMAELSVIVHELETDPRLGQWLDDVEAHGGNLDAWDQANVREMRHKYKHATALPADLVEKLVHAESESVMAWRQSRHANDYASLAPSLDELFKLIRETAVLKSEVFGVSPYEALLDDFDPGRTVEEVDAMFDDLAAFLPPVVDQVIERQKRDGEDIVPEGPFPTEHQRELGEAIMGVFNFPFERGRLDVAHHPFSGGAKDDVRITTRYDEDDFTKSLMAVIHETGHALYEDGLPRDWATQPVGENRGMTLHESQSLLLEMQAGRTDEFISHIAPIVREKLHGSGPAWETENLIKHYRRVGRGLIRVDADEVTYPLHVILRYRLEKAILAEEVTVADLPAVWNEMMQDLVGITPPDDTDGVMQDIHWPSGLFGYFPTYSLGAMTAAQLFATATKASPDILPGLGRGDVEPLFAWLNDNVRSQACLHMPGDLIEQATGKQLSTEAFKSHIKSRYLEV